ncbi:MAG: SIS domain-containing protein [Flavobacteriales bacterium]
MSIEILAKDTLKIESDAINKIISHIDQRFAQCIDFLYGISGRIIVTGIGKSAIIAQKIVATLNSTGSPAIFMHAADAIHGDLGVVQKEDAVMIISKSGNTPEIKVLIPLIKNLGNRIVAIVGNLDSELAKQADFVINASVEREACPNNLAPTTSTTVQLALGDTIAICLLKLRGFTGEDFARYHPGGALGKQLYLKVGELAAKNQKPLVSEHDGIEKVILEITSKRLGITVVHNDAMEYIGVITDGDIRRCIEKTDNIKNLKAKDIMSSGFVSIDKDEMAARLLPIMKERKLNHMIVTDGIDYVGVVHIQDLISEGII